MTTSPTPIPAPAFRPSIPRAAVHVPKPSFQPMPAPRRAEAPAPSFKDFTCVKEGRRARGKGRRTEDELRREFMATHKEQLDLRGYKGTMTDRMSEVRRLMMRDGGGAALRWVCAELDRAGWRYKLYVPMRCSYDGKSFVADVYTVSPCRGVVLLDIYFMDFASIGEYSAKGSWIASRWKGLGIAEIDVRWRKEGAQRRLRQLLGIKGK